MAIFLVVLRFLTLTIRVFGNFFYVSFGSLNFVIDGLFRPSSIEFWRLCSTVLCFDWSSSLFLIDLNFFCLLELLLLTDVLLWGFDWDRERLTDRPNVFGAIVAYTRLPEPNFVFDLDLFLLVPRGETSSEVFMNDAFGFLPHASIVLALSTNYIYGCLTVKASALIECIFFSLLLRLNLLVLRLRPRVSLPLAEPSRKSITSFLSEFFKTCNFYYVFASLSIIKLSILLKLFITFSCIYVVLNSLITLLTWEFFLPKSCCCKL